MAKEVKVMAKEGNGSFSRYQVQTYTVGDGMTSEKLAQQLNDSNERRYIPRRFESLKEEDE